MDAEIRVGFCADDWDQETYIRITLNDPNKPCCDKHDPKFTAEEIAHMDRKCVCSSQMPVEAPYGMVCDACGGLI